jgi:hypothetical protein
LLNEQLGKRLRTLVTLNPDIHRYLERSALVSMPSVPIRDFHCVGRSIVSSLSFERKYIEFMDRDIFFSDIRSAVLDFLYSAGYNSQPMDKTFRIVAICEMRL